MINLIYCHIGDSFPEYIFENIYQTFVVCKFDSQFQLYIITNDKYINKIRTEILKMNVNNNEISRIFIIPCEILESNNLNKYLELKNNLDKNFVQFRNNFWIHTTSRFFYIDALISRFNLTNCFHIENDVMIYKDLNDIYNSLVESNIHTDMIAVQDAPERAICSIIFFPNKESINRFTEYVIQVTKINPSLNDMILLGLYTHKKTFPESPSHTLSHKLGIFDACCLGQYLGGVDFKNLQQNQILNKYINPTIGFINETAVFKPNTVKINKVIKNTQSKHLKKYFIETTPTNSIDINALHIHSKQLYLFSSVFDLKFEDIISINSVLQNVDLVITDQQTLNEQQKYTQYKNIEDVILVKNWKTINQKYFQEIIKKKAISLKTTPLKLFVYGNLFQKFIEHIINILPDDYQYKLYFYDVRDFVDYPYKTNDFTKIINKKNILKIFSTEPDFPIDPKLILIPKGIHYTQQNELYKTMITHYYHKKNNIFYINSNTLPDTPFYSEILNNIKKSSYFSEELQTIHTPFDFHDYQFALSHPGSYSFWQYLYNGVIPVIIKHHAFSNFIMHLNNNNIPHVVINDSDLFEKNYFEKLYAELLKKWNIDSIYLFPFLKLSNYF